MTILWVFLASGRKIAGVMLHGRWLSRADLDAMLEELRAAGAKKEKP